MIGSSINSIVRELPTGTRLVAVSKFHPIEAVQEAFMAGQCLFGENRPQEFAAKVPAMREYLQEKGLNEDSVKWHFIGHLQTNKLKLVLPYADMVESVDSVHLLESIEAWGRTNEKVINVLLELHLGAEDTKGGLTEKEIYETLEKAGTYPHVRIHGLMGMATNTSDEAVVREDFRRISSLMSSLKERFPSLTEFRELSIGMSHDYRIALEYGATLVRVGTKIFGERVY